MNNLIPFIDSIQHEPGCRKESFKVTYQNGVTELLPSGYRYCYMDAGSYARIDWIMPKQLPAIIRCESCHATIEAK